jgi:hypothetical protein
MMESSLNFPAASSCGIGKKGSVFKLNIFQGTLVLTKL